MCNATIVSWGIVGLLFGVPLAIWPYKLARWSEILDAIGRKPAGRVEPAGWKVMLNKGLGVAGTAFGAFVAVGCFLL